MLMDVIMGVFKNADRIAAFVAACAVLYTANVSRSAVRKWRDEKRFDRRFEYAINLLKTAYTARDHIDSIRFNIISDKNIERAKIDLQAKGFSVALLEQNSHLTTAQEVLNRLRIFSSIRDDIINLLPEAQAVFGEDVKNALEEIRRCYFALEVKADSVIELGGDATEYESKKLLINRETDEPDEIEIRLSAQIRIIEEKCRPIVDPDKEEYGKMLLGKENFNKFWNWFWGIK